MNILSFDTQELQACPLAKQTLQGRLLVEAKSTAYGDLGRKAFLTSLVVVGS